MNIEELPDVVYHGTVSVYKESLLSGIDVTKCNEATDFGKGFYTTTLYEQAEELAISRSIIYRKLYKQGQPLILKILIDKSYLNNFKGKFFNKSDSEWKEFIYNNRLGIDFLLSNCYNIGNHIKYHYVYGDMVDSHIAYLVGLRQDEEISCADFLDQLKPIYKKGYNQLSFHSNDVIKALSIQECIILSGGA